MNTYLIEFIDRSYIRLRAHDMKQARILAQAQRILENKNYTIRYALENPP